MSVIKLRLTYPVKGGRYESEYACNYLLGTNYFQPFNRHNSTECRLTCVPLNVQSYRADKNPAIFEESTYNVSTHERKCAYLNTEKRPEWDYQAASKTTKTLQSAVHDHEYETCSAATRGISKRGSVDDCLHPSPTAIHHQMPIYNRLERITGFIT